MTTRQRTRPSQGWTIAGLVLAAVHLTLLSGVALFDDGQLVSDWMGTSVWLLIAAIPAFLAVGGLRVRGLLIAATIVSLPLMFISLAGATLPLLLPAICYAAGYAASAEPKEQA